MAGRKKLGETKHREGRESEEPRKSRNCRAGAFVRRTAGRGLQTGSGVDTGGRGRADPGQLRPGCSGPYPYRNKRFGHAQRGNCKVLGGGQEISEWLLGGFQADAGRKETGGARRRGSYDHLAAGRAKRSPLCHYGYDGGDQPPEGDEYRG